MKYITYDEIREKLEKYLRGKVVFEKQLDSEDYEQNFNILNKLLNNSLDNNNETKNFCIKTFSNIFGTKTATIYYYDTVSHDNYVTTNNIVYLVDGKVSFHISKTNNRINNDMKNFNFTEEKISIYDTLDSKLKYRLKYGYTNFNGVNRIDINLLGSKVKEYYRNNFIIFTKEDISEILFIQDKNNIYDMFSTMDSSRINILFRDYENVCKNIDSSLDNTFGIDNTKKYSLRRKIR